MKVIRSNGQITLVPSGAVSEYNDEAHAELMALLYEVALLDHRPEPRVFVDLTEVTFINSTGLSQLVHAYMSTRMRGGRFALCGASPRIKKIITLVKLDTIFDQYDSFVAAQTAFHSTAK